MFLIKLTHPKDSGSSLPRGCSQKCRRKSVVWRWSSSEPPVAGVSFMCFGAQSAGGVNQRGFLGFHWIVLVHTNYKFAHNIGIVTVCGDEMGDFCGDQTLEKLWRHLCNASRKLVSRAPKFFGAHSWQRGQTSINVLHASKHFWSKSIGARNRHSYGNGDHKPP